MREEEKIFSGVLFNPGDPELKAIKLRSHKLSAQYSATGEDETEIRAELIRQMLAEFGEGSFLQGPVFFHYGRHTKIGRRCLNACATAGRKLLPWRWARRARRS